MPHPNPGFTAPEISATTGRTHSTWARRCARSAFLAGGVVLALALALASTPANATDILYTRASTSGAWLTAADWGGTLPTGTDNAQFGANPTVSATIGINGNGVLVPGSQVEDVGCIELTSARSSLNQVIGNSTTTAAKDMTLAFKGTTVNFVPNTILRNNGAGTTTLTLQDTQGSGTKTMGVRISNSAAIIDAVKDITISSILSSGTSGYGFTKTGAGILTLSAVNTLSGDITITAGTLKLTTGGTIVSVPNITIAGGATLDVSTLTTAITLASSQNLKASGPSTAGTIATTSGKGLTLGTSSTLTFTAYDGSHAPLTVTGSGSLTIAAGNAVTVTVPGSALAVGTYKLVSIGSGNTTAVSGTPASSVTVNGAGGLAAGTVARLVITSGELFLQVSSAPSISVQPANTSACVGSTAGFSVTASGTKTPSYSWAKRGGGWGSAWTKTTSSGGTSFKGSSTDNDFGDTACTSFGANDINSSTSDQNALGIYGGTTGDTTLTRTFTALTSGQGVSIDMDNGNVETGKKVGFSLQTSANADVLQFYFNGGDASYTYNDGSAHLTGKTFQRTGIRVQFMLTSSTTYTLAVTPCGGSTAYFTGIYSGSIAKLKLFNQNVTGGSDHNAYFNRFIVGGYVDDASNYSGDPNGVDNGEQAIASGNGSATYTTPTLVIGDNNNKYEVVVYNDAGVVLSSAATLTVNALPSSTITPSGNTDCVNGQDTFSGPSGTGYAYVWTLTGNNSGASISGSSSSQSVTVNNGASGGQSYTINLQVTASGCSSSSSSTITVVAAPAISVQPASQAACVAGTAAFNITASGVTTYQWQYSSDNGANWFSVSDGTGGTSSQYTTPSLTDKTRSGYKYRCHLVGCGGATLDSNGAATLTVSAPPSISGQPTAQSACSTPGTASYSVTATGDGLTYRWRLNGGNLSDGAQGNGSTVSGATTATLSLSTLTSANTVAAGAGYDCVVSGTSPCSAATSTRVALTVNTVPAVSSSSGDQTVCVNSPATYSVSATGDGLTYHWNLNGTPLSNGGIYANVTTDTLTVTPTSAGDSVIAANGYDCTVSGTCSPSATSTRRALTVSSGVTIDTQPTAQTGCSGNSVNYTVSASGASLTYHWRQRGAGWGNSWSFADNGGTHFLGSSGAINTSGKAWGLNQPNNATAEATRVLSSSLSAGQTFKIDMQNGNVDNGGAVGFSLQNNGHSNNRFEFFFKNGQANYRINDNSSNNRDTGIAWVNSGLHIELTLTATDAYSVSISPVGGGTTNTFTGTLTGTSGDGIDRLRLFNYFAGGGSAWDAFWNNISYGVSDDNAGNYSSWSGDLGQKALANSGTASGSTTATLTLSSLNTGQTGEAFDVVVGSACGSPVTSSSASLTVNATPTAPTTTGASRCGTGSVTLSSTVGSGTLKWYSDAGLTTLVQTSGTTYDTPSLSSTTTYYVSETSADNCASAPTSVTATINPVPSAPTTTGAGRCESGSVTLSATVGSGTLKWYSDAPLTTLVQTGGTTYNTPSLSVTTTYYVTETSAANCVSASSPVTATINSPPSSPATTGASRCGSGSVTLSATSSGGTLKWYSDTGLTTLVQTGAATYNTPSLSVTTSYYVTETSAANCVSASSPVTATINTSPTITPGANPSVCSGAVSANLTYSATTLSPDQYSLVFDSAAHTAGFVDVTLASLPASPIVITVPGAAAVATYNGTLTVKNSTTGCTSGSSAITVTVKAIPSSTITAPGGVCASSTGNIASVPDGGVGATYAWTVSGGTITAGAGTVGITFSANASGSVLLGCTVTSSAGCAAAVGSATVAINSATLTPYVMSSGNYSETFADIANWQNGFTCGNGANRWSSVAANATGTIPDGKKTTVDTATFQPLTATSGVQRGGLSSSSNPAGTIVLLSTGTSDNTTSLAIDLHLDFTGRNAGTLSFDWASVNNSTGNRASSLRIYTSTDGTTFTELATAAVLNFVNNVLTSGSITTVALPSSFDNNATARIRFYYSNGAGGTTGSRPKVAIDNVAVTSTCNAPTAATPTTPSATVCAGTSVTLTETASGGLPSYSYQWKKGGSPISGATSSTYTIPTPISGDTGTYTCEVTSSCGTAATSSGLLLTVNALATVSANVDQLKQAGDTVQLAGYFGGGASSASWSGGGGGYSTSSSDPTAIYTPSVGEVTAGTVTLTLTTDAPGVCPAVSDSLIVTINHAPTGGSHAITTRTNQPATVSEKKLMAGDSDPDAGDTLSITDVSAPQPGDAAVSRSGGVITYTPGSTAGAGSFQYTLADNRGGSTLVTVGVTITDGSSGGGSPNVVYGPAIEGPEFVVRFAGHPGAEYTVEHSTNSTGPWSKKVNKTAPATNTGFGIGVFEFRDTLETSGFYRTVYPSY